MAESIRDKANSEKSMVRTAFLYRIFGVFLLAALALPFPAAAESSDTAQWCKQLQSRLRSVSAERCMREPFVAVPERTAGGRSLVMLDIDSPRVQRKGEAAESKKRVLVIGGIHGDELTSVSTVFLWIDAMRAQEASHYQWRVIPLANPDGLFAKSSTRTNGRGVDLNRNFETADWAKDALAYWTTRTGKDPRRNPGLKAASEVETKWLQDQIEAFGPDLIISVHAPYNLLDYDGPVPSPMRFGRLALNRLGVYPGSMGNYGGLLLKIPVVTIELPHATVMPSPRDQHLLWADMLKWIRATL